MIVYQVRADGSFGGPIMADEHPLRPGQYLIPAGCVTSKPPIKPGFVPIWNGEFWKLQALPEPEEKPQEPEEPIQDETVITRERSAFLLRLADEAIAAAVMAGAAIPKEWREYRAALAAIHNEPSKIVEWPEQPPPIKIEKQEPLPEYAAAKRWAVEVGGITVNGARIDTSAESQAKIAAAVQLSQATSEPIDFKAGSGFISLSPTEMQAIAIAVGRHVQACYSAEKQVQERIQSGEITTKEQVDSFAWPTH